MQRFLNGPTMGAGDWHCERQSGVDDVTSWSFGAIRA